MPNPNKRKGSDFERLAVETLNKLIKDSEWRRIPSSGAMGTFLSEPLLMSDITGKIKKIPKRFRVEAKVGYGGSKQFNIKKEWLDKVKIEADSNYAIPALIGKFAGAKDGVKVFVVLDVETFAEIINGLTSRIEDD